MSKAPAPSKGKNTSYYVCSLIGILLIFGFGHLPPLEPITTIGMHIIGIFLGMIFLWSFVSILWPSLLGIVAIGISGYAPMRQAILVAFGDVVPVLVLFAMVLFGAIQNAGVTTYLSRWFLTRKVINGRPIIFSFVFIYTTYILAALSASVLPPLLLMWAILYSVLKEVGYKKGDPYTAIMVLGTMLGAISGQAAKPFTGSALVMVGAFERVSESSLDYLPYMLFGIIMSTLVIIGYTLLIKFVFRPDTSKIKNISTEDFNKEKLPPMNLQQKILLGCLFGFLALVLLPSILPTSIPVVSLLNKFGPHGIIIVFVVGLSLFKVDGEPILDFPKIAGRFIVWDVYFLVCMSILVSGALTAPSTGITAFLTTSLDPVFGGHSAFFFAIMVVIFAMFITQVANNAVMGVVLMPVIKIFSEQSGGNFVAIATVMIFALHVAMLTPASSPYAAILHGNKEWVSQKEIFRYGGVAFVMAMVLYIVVGVPVANFLN